MKLISVVLDIPTQALDSTFTYVAIENEMIAFALQIGSARFKRRIKKKPKDELIQSGIKIILSSNQLKFLLMIYLVLSLQRHCLMAHLTLHRERIQLLKTLSIQRGESLFGCRGPRGGVCGSCSFGHRSAVGFVVGIAPFAPGDSFPEDIKPTQLKEIKKVLSKPYFTEIGARCAAFMAERYIAPFSTSIRLFMPQAAFLGLSTLKAPGS